MMSSATGRRVNLQEEIETARSRLQRNDPTFTELELSELRTLHYEPSFEEFIQALHGNEFITMVKVGGEVLCFTEVNHLDILFDALGTLPNLESLEFNTPHNYLETRVSAIGLAGCLRAAQNLKIVVIWPYIRFSQETDVDTLKMAVRNHPSLQHLILPNVLLGYENTTHSLDPLVDIMVTIPKLQCFHIAAGLRSRGCWVSEGSLMRMLQNCDGLENVALRNLGLDDEHAKSIARLLSDQADTSPILVLDLRYNAIKEDGHKALAAMVKTNLRILNVCIDAECGRYIEELEFNLKLNRAGRYLFMKDPNATKGMKVNKLIESCNDPTVTFHLLLCQPSLCDIR